MLGAGTTGATKKGGAESVAEIDAAARRMLAREASRREFWRVRLLGLALIKYV